MSDEKAIEDNKSQWRTALPQGISIAAFLEDDDGKRGRMISCNILELKRKEEKDRDANSLKVSELSYKQRVLIETMADMKAKADVFALYKCDSYIGSCGLYVDAMFQRRGIGVEMLEARAEVGRLTNTPVSATVFTSEASQRTASRCGYQTLHELDVRTYRLDGQVVYPNPQFPIARLMAIRYF